MDLVNDLQDMDVDTDLHDIDVVSHLKLSKFVSDDAVSLQQHGRYPTDVFPLRSLQLVNVIQKYGLVDCDLVNGHLVLTLTHTDTTDITSPRVCLPYKYFLIQMFRVLCWGGSCKR